MPLLSYIPQKRTIINVFVLAVALLFWTQLREHRPTQKGIFAIMRILFDFVLWLRNCQQQKYFCIGDYSGLRVNEVFRIGNKYEFRSIANKKQYKYLSKIHGFCSVDVFHFGNIYVLNYPLPTTKKYMNCNIQRVYIPLNLCFGIIANNNNLFRGKRNMKIRTYEILKLDINRLAKVDGKKIKVVPLTITKEEALLNGELIRVQESQMIRVICEYFSGQTIDMSQIIVNIHVPTELKTTGEKMYLQCAENGITVNGNHYKRFASGSGQIRNNTVTFLREDLVEPITEKLMCGLEFVDFGNDFNSAKFNAYFGLNMSGCHLLPDSLTPSVCVVDDYEAIRPHDVVNYVTEREVDYIVLPTGDYILNNNDPAFVVEDGKATRVSDGSVFVVRHGIKKDIAQEHYDEIDNSPCLNSFDGQGLMSPEWSAKVSEFLGFGYCASEMIVRAPWVKGLLATVDFKQWFSEHGISEIRDSFGKVRNVADIDVIISKSQFKMHKIYARKVQGTNINAWDYHRNCMIENGLHWGIVKPNKPEDHEKTLNYQYIEALDIDGSDIDRLCKRTKDYLESLNSGDIREVYKNLIQADSDYEDNNGDDTEEKHKPRYEVALNANAELTLFI